MFLMTNDPPFEAVAYQMHLFSVRGWNAAMEAAEAGESVGSTVRVTLNDDRFQKHRIPLVGKFGKDSDDGKMMNMLNQKIFFLVRRLVYFITISCLRFYFCLHSYLRKNYSVLIFKLFGTNIMYILSKRVHRNQFRSARIASGSCRLTLALSIVYLHLENLVWYNNGDFPQTSASINNT